MGPDNGASPHEHPNQFALLRQRRFAPFFWTQFLGRPTTTCSSSPSR
jgi:hypothetical protein